LNMQIIVYVIKSRNEQTCPFISIVFGAGQI